MYSIIMHAELKHVNSTEWTVVIVDMCKYRMFVNNHNLHLYCWYIIIDYLSVQQMWLEESTLINTAYNYAVVHQLLNVYTMLVNAKYRWLTFAIYDYIHTSCMADGPFYMHSDLWAVVEELRSLTQVEAVTPQCRHIRVKNLN